MGAARGESGETEHQDRPLQPRSLILNPNPPKGVDHRRGIDRSAEGISRSYGDALRAADGAAAERVALECLREGMSVEALYARVIAPAMWRIGRLWAEGAITVADEHLATALTHRVLASVYGSSLGNVAVRPGRILLATVEGQRHSLGLRMAADVLELGGYEVIYLGGDVPLDSLVDTVAARNPDLVGLSSTLFSAATESALELRSHGSARNFPIFRSCSVARASRMASWFRTGWFARPGSRGSWPWRRACSSA